MSIPRFILTALPWIVIIAGVIMTKIGDESDHLCIYTKKAQRINIGTWIVLAGLIFFISSHCIIAGPLTEKLACTDFEVSSDQDGLYIMLENVRYDIDSDKVLLLGRSDSATYRKISYSDDDISLASVDITVSPETAKRITELNDGLSKIKMASSGH